MKAIIRHNHNFPEHDISINLNASIHNVSFSHVNPCNCLFVKLHHFPRKEILQQLQEYESGEVGQLKSYIRIAVKKQRTDLVLIVRYSVRSGVQKNQYTIHEKERPYIIQYNKQELIDLVHPFMNRLYESNTKADADSLKSYFDEYVNPSTLSAISNRITKEQERKAVQILAAYFGF